MNLLNYEKPNNLSDAYELLNQNKSSVVIAGGAYLRLQKRNIGLGIDLMDLGLNYIKVKDGKLIIGSMTTLRDIERSDITNEHLNGVLNKMVCQVGGIQLRNIATVGGSICGKYGFSDVITVLLSLDAELNFFDHGTISLNNYLSKDIKKDILKEIIINLDQKSWFKYFKKTYKEFSLLNVAVTKDKELFRFAVGARPGIAKLVEVKENDINVANVLSNFEFKDDYRASGDYRKSLARGFIDDILNGVD